jgi:hypothetical protein
LAEQTYQQSADGLKGRPAELNQAPRQDPVSGVTYVDHEDNK